MATINLTKDSGPVKLSKGTRITAEVSWPAATDYDLGAEISYTDGSTESIATFGASGLPPKAVSRNGTVRHGGDAARGAGTATETITVDPDPEIQSVAFWAYSAQSNGSGSFRRYAVSMAVSDGSSTVSVAADNASENDGVYTCVPGVVSFHDGVPQVEQPSDAGAIYSSPGSERRPAFRKGVLKGTKIKMDAGPRNIFK